MEGPSAGSWIYGYWNPNIGYGFADPLNQIQSAQPVSAGNKTIKRMTLYPNPATKRVTIDAGELNENATLELVNLQGQVAARHYFITNNKLQLEVYSLPPGLYIARIKDGLKVQNRKIFIRDANE